jgi:hypothetical protein
LTLGHVGWANPLALFSLPQGLAVCDSEPYDYCSVCGVSDTTLWKFECRCMEYCVNCIPRKCMYCLEWEARTEFHISSLGEHATAKWIQCITTWSTGYFLNLSFVVACSPAHRFHKSSLAFIRRRPDPKSTNPDGSFDIQTAFHTRMIIFQSGISGSGIGN